MSSPRALHATLEGVAKRVDLCSDSASVLALLVHACEDAGLVGVVVDAIVDDRATLSVALALSSGHASVHTDKATGATFLDAFSVDSRARPLKVLDTLRRAFEIERGREDATARVAEG
jgi:S-adenosylmethionine/arginine decarboxylase-like enzyme